MPRKEDCPTCVAGRDALDRMPIGLCGPDCLVRRWRQGRAEVRDGRWV